MELTQLTQTTAVKTETVELGPQPAPPPRAPAVVKKEEAAADPADLALAQRRHARQIPEEEAPGPSIRSLPPESGTARGGQPEAEAEKRKPKAPKIPKPAPVPAFPAGPPEPGRPPFLRKRPEDISEFGEDKHLFVKKKNTIRKNKVRAPCRMRRGGAPGPCGGD